MKENFIKLTNTVYKVLEFFPESDPLKNRAKDKALAIMDNLILINETSGWASFQKEKIKVSLLEDIDALLGYLWIAKNQNWLSAANFLILSNEYEKIRSENAPVIELKQSPPQEIKTQAQPKGYPESVLSTKETIKKSASSYVNVSEHQNLPTREVTARQKKILEFLKSNEKAQVMDLQATIGNITKRTIRRDLEELLEMGKITRLGEFNQVFYKISK